MTAGSRGGSVRSLMARPFECVRESTTEMPDDWMAAVSRVEELETRISELSRAEKAVLAQSLLLDLADSFPGIESIPGVCGGEPCIVRTRIPVWILEQMRRLGVSEADILRSYPTLRAGDLVHAWAWVERNRGEIDRLIQENEDA